MNHTWTKTAFTLFSKPNGLFLPFTQSSSMTISFVQTSLTISFSSTNRQKHTHTHISTLCKFLNFGFWLSTPIPKHSGNNLKLFFHIHCSSKITSNVSIHLRFFIKIGGTLKKKKKKKKKLCKPYFTSSSYRESPNYKSPRLIRTTNLQTVSSYMFLRLF